MRVCTEISQKYKSCKCAQEVLKNGNGVLVSNAEKAVNSDTPFMSLIELERYKQIPSNNFKKLQNPASNIMECYKSLNDFLQELVVDDQSRFIAASVCRKVRT